MKELRVRDVMTADPTTLKRNDKLTLADDIMRLGRVRHLPVLDDDDQILVGIVTQRDLFRDALAQALGYGKHAQRKILDTLSVKDVMATEVVTVSPDASLVEAARLLTERKIGCLPVVDNGRLVGILTEGDFVALIARVVISSEPGRDPIMTTWTTLQKPGREFTPESDAEVKKRIDAMARYVESLQRK